jgi:hypothetical protein
MIDHTHENQQLLFAVPHVDLAEVDDAGLALDFFCFLPLALPLLLPLLPFLLGVLLPPLSPTCFRCFLLSPIFFSC